jgi:trk system potassium uptake protein TrkH
MNYRLISKILGILLLLVAAAMFSCEVYAWVDGDLRSGRTNYALLYSGIISAAAGTLLAFWGRGSGRDILRKEAIAIVGLGWILSALAGAIPYMLCQPSLGFSAAFFESASGFTTTGSSAIPDLSLYSRDMLLWRSMTQWLGGMGILVLFVALLSMLGVGSKALFQNESTVQLNTAFYTRIQNTALKLWQIYLGLTIICAAGLFLMGVSLYESVLYTFATVATGGFAPYNESAAALASPMIDAWICLFMLIGGTNFILLSWVIRGHPLRLFQNEEFRFYLLVMLLGTAVVTYNLLSMGVYDRVGVALQHASFQVVSLGTTTGFATANYNQWPALSQIVLLMLMLIGGCAGSTSGSIKAGRWLILLRAAGQQIVNSFRPNQVIRVRLNGQVLPEETKNHAVFFIALIFGIAGLCMLAIGMLEPHLDLVTVTTSVIATLFNIGPGFGEVGPVGNFACLSSPSLFLLGLLMILGRLELFAILALFVPALWRRY